MLKLPIIPTLSLNKTPLSLKGRSSLPVILALISWTVASSGAGIYMLEREVAGLSQGICEFFQGEGRMEHRRVVGEGGCILVR